ncbi:hypothetical protein J23TS9_09340 [Paenibacillus sp. J23TS9]|nr:hypothetical protein J23TS9_09340 [Paenibacillus sp. J23TS9]
MIMFRKIQLMLNVAFFPIKDLLYFQSEELVNIALCIHQPTKKNGKQVKEFLDKLCICLVSENMASSIDEINLMLEKFHPYLFQKHFSPEISSYEEMEICLYNHYFHLIQQFTRALLSHRDGEMVFKYWKHELGVNDEQLADVWGAYTELDKVHMFSILSRLLPIDLFVASYYSNNGLHEPLQLDGFYQHINLADAPLHDALRNGVSENHMHASAAFTFTMLWQNCMNFSGDFSNTAIGKYLINFNVSYSNKSKQVKEYVLTAQLLRLVLAHYMTSDTEMSVTRWIRIHVGSQVQSIAHLIFNNSALASVEELKEAIEYIRKEYDISGHEEGTDWIIAVFKDYTPINTYGENVFLHQIMKYRTKLEKRGEKEELNEFLYLFFRYLRIKNEFYQQVNQSNAVNGLDYFRSYFDRATSGFDKRETHYFLDMLRNLFQNQYLRKVELRLSIANRESTNRQNIKKLLQAYKQILVEDYHIDHNIETIFPRIGIVYHLIKQKDDIYKDWKEYIGDRSQISSLHYGRLQQEYLNKIDMILCLRERIPYLSNFIVGLDAASLENSTPVQVFAPVFERARNSDNDQMLLLDRDGYKIKQQSLFFTFHAGEDYRHLNSGIRRIDEVIDYCKFHSGDRIGHGISLGISVDRWIQDNEQVILPRGEYLDNLLWIWGVYTRSSDINFRTYSYLQHKIYEVAKIIIDDAFNFNITIEMLYEVYQLRFKPIEEIIDANSIYTTFKPIKKAIQNVIRIYHDKVYLERLMAPIFVRTTEIEKEMTMDMQRFVRNKVAQHGIVIEVNPSSNFVIGQLNSLYENQFFQIHKNGDNNVPSTMMSINTDDPIVFNTNISNEIAYMYYGMLQKGVNKSEALNWIEYVRKSGMDTSFLRDNVSNYDYLKQLDCLLDALDDPYYCEEG